MHVWSSSCRVKPRRPRSRLGFTRQPREPKRAHLRVPGLQKKHHQNSTRRPQEREKKKENGCGRGKNSKFWAVRRKGPAEGGGPNQHATHNTQQHTATSPQHPNNTHNTQHNTTQKWIGQNWTNHKPLTTNIGQKWIGQSRPHPPPDPSPPNRPKFRSFFLSRSHSVLFLSLVVFSWNFGGVFEGRDPEMCTFGVRLPEMGQKSLLPSPSYNDES